MGQCRRRRRRSDSRLAKNVCDDGFTYGADRAALGGLLLFCAVFLELLLVLDGAGD